MRSDCPSPAPDLFICLRAMQGGCLRHPLDSPEIQFTDGERVPDFAQINSEVLLRLTKLYSLNISMTEFGQQVDIERKY